MRFLSYSHMKNKKYYHSREMKKKRQLSLAKASGNLSILNCEFLWKRNMSYSALYLQYSVWCLAQRMCLNVHGAKFSCHLGVRK